MQRTNIVILKRLLALAAAAGIPTVAHATFTLETGTSTLDSAFATLGGQSITVSWNVTESGTALHPTGLYTYNYTVNDPAGEVQLGTTTPEDVDYFSVSFNATPAHVVITQTGGTQQNNNGANGLSWDFTAITPGNSSPTLTFTSDDAPGTAPAEADDHVAPSPWVSGDLVPAPVPEPATLIAGAMLLLPYGASTLRTLRKNRKV